MSWSENGTSRIRRCNASHVQCLQAESRVAAERKVLCGPETIAADNDRLSASGNTRNEQTERSHPEVGETTAIKPKRGECRHNLNLFSSR